MDIITQCSILMIGGIFIGILFVRLYVSYKTEQHKDEIAEIINDVREEYKDKCQKIIKMREESKTKSRYVVKYNTTINGLLIQQTAVINIVGTPTFIKIKNKLAEKSKKEFALNDCSIVSITHINDYSDFTIYTSEKEEQEINDYSSVNEKYQELVMA